MMGHNLHFYREIKKKYLRMVTKYSLLVDLMFCLLIQVNGTFIEAECEKLSGEGLLALKVCSIANSRCYPKVFKYWDTKTINFPFVSNGKLMVFKCPNVQAQYNEAVIYLNFGTLKNNEFSIWNKWKIYYF